MAFTTPHDPSTLKIISPFNNWDSLIVSPSGVLTKPISHFVVWYKSSNDFVYKYIHSLFKIIPFIEIIS